MQPQTQPAAAAAQPPSGGAEVAHAITHNPSFAMLRLDLQPGQTVTGEAGSMVARHQQVEMQTRMNANPTAGLFAKLWAVLVALLRKLVGGETFFVNRFSAAQPGSVWLAPKLSGDVRHRRLQGETLVLSTGAYVAHTGAIDVKLRFGGLRGLLAKEGAFFLELRGQGDVWFNSYGSIHAVEVEGSYVIDNGHLVGFEGGLDFDIKGAGGGALGFFASGEGLVCEFRGRGTVYLQSRNLGSLVSWLSPMLPS